MEKASVKSKINAAAIELFSEYGYHGASVDDIAKKAGVAKGSVYYHYRNKEELFLSVIQSGIDYICFKMENALLAQSGREAAFGIVKALADMFLSYPKLSALILNDTGVEETLYEKVQAHKKRVIEIIAKALKDGQILNLVHQTDPHLAAIGCVFFTYAYTLHAKNRPDFSPPDCILEISDILSRGLIK